MNVLVLGGTQFIGRHVVLELLRGGHAVTILNRGVTPDDLPPEVERLRGDRDLGPQGVAAMRGRRFDACVDLSGYTAVHVRSSLDALQGQVGRYVFVSAVAAYRVPGDGPVDESAPLVDAAPEHVTEVAGDMYGRLKVTCERIVGKALGERATILRPQIVVGPFDPTPRLTHWLRRAREPGTMLAPGDGSDHVQVVDVGDVARFAALVVERDLAGTYNLSGERPTWSRFIALLAPPSPCWVPSTILDEAGLDSMDLALYRASGSLRSSLMHVSNARAVRAGMTVTPLPRTLERVRAWMDERNPDSEALKPEVERRLIELAQGR